MLSVFRTSVKCARPTPFWREVEALGVVNKDMNSEKVKHELTIKNCLERSSVILNAF